MKVSELIQLLMKYPASDDVEFLVPGDDPWPIETVTADSPGVTYIIADD